MIATLLTTWAVVSVPFGLLAACWIARTAPARRARIFEELDR